jgi:phosphotransferase system enzyme I (PtsP)
VRPQIRALLAAAAERELRVMFPMVTLASEVDVARRLLEQESELRRRRGKPLPSSIQVGAMIETPAAAWRVEEIAERVDFMSVGGNDLAQFYFAADRESELTQHRFDPIEPGFLSFLDMLSVRASRTGRPLSWCGEQAADPLMAAALIGLGIQRFSVPATSIGPFKRLVRSIDAGALADWLRARLKGRGGSFRDELADHLKASSAALP